LDFVERILRILCGVLLLSFVLTISADVVLRDISHPWLTAQEWSLAFFVWGSFLGAAVAFRRDQHFKLAAIAESLHGWARIALETFNRLVVLAVAACMAVYGYQFFLTGLTTYIQPSTTPIAPLYAAIPVSGLLIALFCVEELVNGWRKGFEPQPPQ
jgi:TRAP-type C4-dicarboxylate transport system permease small subunit